MRRPWLSSCAMGIACLVGCTVDEPCRYSERTAPLVFAGELQQGGIEGSELIDTALLIQPCG